MGFEVAIAVKPPASDVNLDRLSSPSELPCSDL